MDNNYKILSEFMGGMSSASISGTYESPAKSGPRLFRKYNYRPPRKDKPTNVPEKAPKPPKSSTQKMKP